MGRHHVDLAGVAMAGLVGVRDQLAEPDNMTLGLRHQLVGPLGGGEPLTGLLERRVGTRMDPSTTCGLMRISWTASWSRSATGRMTTSMGILLAALA